MSSLPAASMSVNNRKNLFNNRTPQVMPRDHKKPLRDGLIFIIKSEKMAHLTTDPSNESRWIVVYPNFLNSRKTKKDGRKISKSKAVDNPRCNEMKDVLQYHGFNCLVEELKQYPRDALCKGRVRIQLKNSDGTIFNPQYPTRESLMILLGEMIPKLKSRQAKGTTADTISQSSKKGKEKKKK